MKVDLLRFFKITIVLFGVIISSQGFSLTCPQIKDLINISLRAHLSFHEFDSNLSERTFENYIKTLDPGKLYLYEADVKTLSDKYKKNIHKLIKARKCNFINDFINVYTLRFKEINDRISSLVDLKHDFSIDEYLELDRKKIGFAKDEKELTDRWRKRIKFQLLQLISTGIKDDKAKEKIKKRYYLLNKDFQQETLDTFYERFLVSFTTALDPHSEYLSNDELKDFRIATSLAMEGIGALLRSEDGFVTIVSLVPGGSASKSKKLKVEDKIVAVKQQNADPVDVIDMNLKDVVDKIRGPEGTTVTLTVVREEKGVTSKFDVTLKREKIKLEERKAKSRVVSVNVETKEQKKRVVKIGVLNLPSFYIDFEGQSKRSKDYTSSAHDVLTELNKLKASGIDGLVVDLRANGGGSLTESIKIAGFFFREAPVVQVKDGDGATNTYMDDDKGIVYEGPMSVLISRQSASASEIFAGAIRDLNRGIIIGDSHTFGKGTVQNLQDLKKLGGIKITISSFYRPSGSSTQMKGVDSDVVIPSISDELDIGEKFYDYALPWDSIKSAKYENFDMIKNYPAILSKLSEKRVKSDKAFSELLKDIEKQKQKKEDKYKISLKKDQDIKTSTPEKDEDLDEINDVRLENDPTLQESLRITADYSQLLQGHTPLSASLDPSLIKKAKSKKNLNLKKTGNKSKKRK